MTLVCACAKAPKPLFDSFKFSLNTFQSQNGGQHDLVAAIATVVRNGLVGMFWTAVEERIAECSPDVVDSRDEIQRFFSDFTSTRLIGCMS